MVYIDYNNPQYMARITATECKCGCKMKRLYIRADGGKGWDSIGWMCMCGCGCITLDNTDMNSIGCEHCL